MEPLDYLRIFKRRWPLIGATVALSLIIAIVVGFLSRDTAETSYSATATLLAEGGPSLDLQTLATVATSDIVARRAATELGLPGQASRLQSLVEVSPAPQPGILTVVARSSDADIAEETATAFAQELSGFVRRGEVAETPEGEREVAPAERAQTEKRIASLRRAVRAIEREFVEDAASADSQLELQQLQTILSVRRGQKEREISRLETNLEEASAVEVGGDNVMPPRLRIIEEPNAAEVTVAEVGTSPKVVMLAAVCFGLLLGLGLALAVEYFDPRLYDAKEAENHFGFPVVAHLSSPRNSRWKNSAKTATSGGPELELLGSLLLARNGSGKERRLHDPPEEARSSGTTIVVTSAGRDENSDAVVSNLASAVASLGKNVTVVSWLAESNVTAALGVEPSKPGLAEYINTGSHRVNVVSHAGHVEGVRVIPMGVSDGSTLALASSPRADELLNEARKESPVIIMQAPALSSGASSAILIDKAEAVLVVARLGTTTAEAAARAGDTLKRIQAPVIGLILQDATRPTHF